MSWAIERTSQFVDTPDGRLAYRVDGQAHAPTLVLCQRFRGTMDHWDPEFVGRLALTHRVVRFDNAGIGESTGTTPKTVRDMSRIAVGFLDALGLDVVDMLGWSLGGYVAQKIALDFPGRLRRLVIAGSGPGGPDGPSPHPRVAEIAANVAPSRDDIRFLFFTDTADGIAAANRHFDCIGLEELPPVDPESGGSQREAVVAWWSGAGAARFRLGELTLPILVANGNHDVMIPPEHSFAITVGARNAKLVLYPDAGHAFLFQYAEAFVGEVVRFLGSSA